MTKICEQYQISRKTGHKWLSRYQAFGPEALRDRPSAPLQNGRATDAALVARL